MFERKKKISLEEYQKQKEIEKVQSELNSVKHENKLKELDNQIALLERKNKIKTLKKGSVMVQQPKSSGVRGFISDSIRSTVANRKQNGSVMKQVIFGSANQVNPLKQALINGGSSGSLKSAILNSSQSVGPTKQIANQLIQPRKSQLKSMLFRNEKKRRHIIDLI